MHLNLDTSFVKRIEHWLDGLWVGDCCIEVWHSDIKADWNANQDMNWKIGWDICLNVGYWDTGLGTGFNIGLGFGQNTTVDWDFGLSWSTDSGEGLKLKT